MEILRIVFRGFLLLLSVLSFTNADAQIIVDIQDTSAVYQDTVRVAVFTGNVTGYDLYGIDIAFTYDPGILTPLNVGVENCITEDWIWGGEPAYNISVPGSVRVALFGIDPLAGSGRILYTTFIVSSPGAGASSIDFWYLYYNEGEIATTPVNGSLGVKFRIGGAVTLAGSPLSGVDVYLGGDGNTHYYTTGNGNYVHQPLNFNGNYTVTPTRSGFTFTPGTRSYNSIQNNFSSQNFTATDIGDPEITLNRPNGGEFFNIGTVEEIQWSATDNEDEVQSVSIYLSRDSGSNYTLIASNEENDGVYDYSVTAPNSDVCKVYVIAYDNSGNFSADTTDGVFSIGTDVYEIEGRVSYFSTDLDLEDFDVILAGNPTDTTTTNQSGNYNFTDVDPGDFTLRPYSDRQSPVNVVTPLDATALLHDIAGADTLTGYASIAGDVNNDNLKGVYDVALIARYIIGDIDDSWAYNWTFVPTSYSMTPNNWQQAPDHIEYSPLNANMYNQDFKGIVAGDVTGNFDGFGLFTQYDFPEKRKKLRETADPLDVILVNIGDTTVCNVGFVWIPVILENTNGYDVYSLDGTLRYDPDVLRPDTATADSCVSSLWEYKIFFSGGSGMVRFIAGGSTPLEAGGYLIRIGFRIQDSTSTAYSDIAIDSLALNDNYVPSEVSNGSISICPVGVDDEIGIPSSFSLEGNYPNPFNPSTTIRFNVPDNGYVDFDVYNLLGQAIYNRNDLRVHPGSNDIEFSSPSLGSGLYYYRIKYGNEFKIGKMLLLK